VRVLRLTIEYDGTDLVGWQRQAEGISVQGLLEDALAAFEGGAVTVHGAGRTDAGVHACGQVAAVRVTRVPSDLARLQKSLNALTPDDIAIREIALVDDGFDPRRDARSRVYEYRILNAPAPSPFWWRYAWHVPDALDAPAMHDAAKRLEGEHDFEAFRGADPEPVRSTVRRVLESAVHGDAPFVVFRIEATAFLKHMVRNLVGTLVEVGRGARPVDALAELLAARDRTRAGATAPAHGLVLVRVRY